MKKDSLAVIHGSFTLIVVVADIDTVRGSILEIAREMQKLINI